MECITKERLKKAGWDKVRKIDISKIQKQFLSLDISLPENVKNFLSQYGNLVFNEGDRKEDLEFIPDKALGCNLDKEYFLELLEEYDVNEMVYPIGVACRGNLTVLMTVNDEFYCFTDGYLEKAGESIEEMLDCLVGECREAEVIE